jgi:hypothetical protein
MASALTGTSLRNAVYDASDGVGGQCVADSADTFAYVAAARSAAPKIYQITISSAAVSGGSWPLTAPASFPAGIALSQDDATMYTLLDNGDMYSSPISSPALTKLPATFNNLDGFTATWSGLLLDPVYPWRLLAWNRSAKKVYVYDLQSQQATYYAVPGGTHFVVGIGRYRPDPNVFLVALGATGGGMGGDIIMKWYRQQHRWEVFAGNGMPTQGASGGVANQTGIVQSASSNTRTWASDDYGRVYLGRGTTTLTKVENGVLTDLTTAFGGTVVGGCWYLPSLNQCLVKTNGGKLHVVS